MQVSIKNRIRKIAIVLICLFFVLFVGRIGYGYVYKSVESGSFESDFFRSAEKLRKNYASEKRESKEMSTPSVSFEAKKAESTTAPKPMQQAASSQKYEKTASTKSKSSHFEEDEKKVRKVAKDYTAIIQYEHNSGNKGNRELHLMIGVNPDKFDSCYMAIQKIGTIRSTEITKTDKNNEYRQLNAEKASLEKTLTSLSELKAKSGTIADYISLHEKMMEIEEKLQEYGVELGNFDEENEFCTIKFSLYEGFTSKPISFYHRVKVALEWAIKYYAVLMLSLVFMGIAAFVLAFLIEKLNILGGILKKIRDEI